MRRTDRQVTDLTEIAAILNRCDTIRLGLQGEEYPYVVPLSFGWEMVDGTIYIYFHGAKEGHKVDAIARHDKVSLCVMDEDTPDDSFSRYVRSVIVFGRIAPVEDHAKAMEKAWGLAMHIFPEQTEFYRNDLKRNESRVQVLELVPEHITGKRVHEQ